MSACLFVDPATCIDMPSFVFNADFGFLFWDVVHPTTEAHRHLGEYMFQQLRSEYDRANTNLPAIPESFPLEAVE
jgi:phospholipase/lecithinase/hemolysin